MVLVDEVLALGGKETVFKRNRNGHKKKKRPLTTSFSIS